jgi:hypothetical protein
VAGRFDGSRDIHVLDNTVVEWENADRGTERQKYMSVRAYFHPSEDTNISDFQVYGGSFPPSPIRAKATDEYGTYYSIGPPILDSGPAIESAEGTRATGSKGNRSDSGRSLGSR